MATYLGNNQFPWYIEATLTGSTNPATELIFTTTAMVVNGYATFTDLGISLADPSFTISYNIKVPEGVNKYTINLYFFFICVLSSFIFHMN